MADVKSLKLSRRNLKGQLTRTLSTIDSLLTGDGTLLKQYIDKAEEQFSQIEAKHMELAELIVEDEAFEAEEEWMRIVEMDFVQKLVRAKQVVDHHPQPTLDVSNTSNTQDDHQGGSVPVAQSSSSGNPLRSLHAPKMARIKFPTFNGEIKEYQHFKSMFDHCTQGLSDIECFFQLTEAMVNHKERSMVKSCVNVQRAWQVLDECFGDRDRVVDSLLTDLSNLKPYEHKGKVNTSTMAQFVQTLQNFECQAETIGLSGELNSKIMLGQIKQKLPESHRMEYYKEVRDGKVGDSLSGLTKWLYQQYLLLEKIKCSSEVGNHTSKSEKVMRYSNAASLDHSKQRNGKGKQSGVPKCALHENSSTHYLKTCNKFRSLPLDEKYSIIKKNNICQRCGHNNCVAGKPPYDLNACQFPAPCKTQNCGSDRHFSAICPVIYGQRFKSQPDRDADRSTTMTASVKTVTNRDSSGLQSILPTVMGYIRHGNTKHLVRILLDCGSQATLLREGILPTTSKESYQDYELNLVGGRMITKKLRLVECCIEDLNGNWSCPLTVTEIEEPCGDAPIVQPEHLQSYDHLRDIDLHDAPSETVDLLLGVENTHLMVWEDYIVGDKPDDPVAVRCPFGWFVQGGKSSNSTRLLNYVNVSAIGALEEFIGLETVGTEPKRCRCGSDSLDRDAIEAMEQSVTRRQDGSYEITLPWKRSPEGLPDNYDYAVKRLKGLENQFKDRPADWKVYCKQMEDQLHRDVSRLVSETEIQSEKKTGKNMWFLPHFAVKKDSVTTPVRVVYDSKARFQGHSLNEYLSKGLNLNSELFNVALRFRENEIGVIADIRKMFQAVKIRADDARYHRFVFRENPSQAIRVYELTTVTFGDKPSPAAAIVALRHVISQHASNDEQLRRVVKDQFYMDDLNESVASVEEALELKSKLKETLKEGNFDIRKWQSNRKEVCDETENTDTTTVLGTSWNLAKDMLSVKAVQPSDDTTLTKRKILAQTASFYDIFGMLSGVLVRSKILLQRLWRLEFDWDTPIDQGSELHSLIKKVNQDLEGTHNLKIDRCLIPEPYRGKRPLPSVTMHGASDASEDAMGFAIWLRWSHDESQEAHLSFVCARSRVTPLKQTSMPRKELQALLLLSRLMVTVKAALRFNIDGWKMWTDSMTAISWLKGQSKSFRSYVAHRVGEITSEFDPYRDIAYVPSDQNAADLLSRGGTATEMNDVIKGPKYLRLPPQSWPETPVNIPMRPKDPERKKFHSRNAKVLGLAVNAASKNSPVIDATKFSSWSRLRMVTARVLSLKDIPRKQWLKQLTQQISLWPSQKTIREAELYWVRQAQREIDLEDPNIQKLDPFYDEGDEVYRVGGRLDRAPLSHDIRHPYLLPKKSHISYLIVQDRHLHALHGGHLRTANEVRKKFWIVGDVNIARRVVRDCVTCRKHRGKPSHQRMADLPDFRISPCSPPFKTTLVDYLGPVNVKLNRNTTTKGYCALFTCAVTRAVHLTVVQDLSTQAFLQALERFVSTRGAPALMVSDNATCFRGADNTINELNLKLNQTQVREHCLRYNVQWRFGPPSGPHHQGAVERMVQEVKKAMRHLVTSDRLTFVEWETVFCKISGLINNRPITAMSSSPLDDAPLTPNHFLIGRGDLPCPDIPCEDFTGNPQKRRELCNAMVDGFWRRWMECLRKLSPRQKWQQSTECLQEKDIVLVIGEEKQRGFWKMAEIASVHPGEDNLVRVVTVKFADGKHAKRPVTKLIMLMKKEERSDV